MLYNLPIFFISDNPLNEGEDSSSEDEVGGVFSADSDDSDNDSFPSDDSDMSDDSDSDDSGDSDEDDSMDDDDDEDGEEEEAESSEEAGPSAKSKINCNRTRGREFYTFTRHRASRALKSIHGNLKSVLVLLQNVICPILRLSLDFKEEERSEK